MPLEMISPFTPLLNSLIGEGHQCQEFFSRRFPPFSPLLAVTLHMGRPNIIKPVGFNRSTSDL